ncbi:MAG: TfoX/Sxy family protein [Acutalibacteraceae bacterium]
MASSKDYLNFVLEQLSGLSEISFRPMMGEFIIYYHGKVVGGIYDNQLLIKPFRSAKALMPQTVYEVPYSGAKEMLLVDSLNDKEFLARLFEAIYSDFQRE